MVPKTQMTKRKNKKESIFDPFCPHLPQLQGNRTLIKNLSLFHLLSETMCSISDKTNKLSMRISCL